MDERQLREILEAEAVPPPEENARKEAINLALAAFDQAQAEQKSQSRHKGFGWLARLTGRNTTRPKGRPMNARQIYAYGGTAMALLVMVTTSMFVARDWLASQRAAPQLAEVREAPKSSSERLRGSALTDRRNDQAAGSGTPAEAEGDLRSQAQPTISLAQESGQPRAERALQAVTPSAPAAQMSLDEVVPPHYRDVGRDRFQSVEQNPVKRVAEDPVSTFSIDVDTASYAFVRRQLNSGVLPQKAAVRVEELINYFDYAYPLPESRERPFAASVAVTPSPWKEGNKLIHIGIKGYDLESAAKPRSNLVFLLDVSGSMNAPDKLPLLVNSFKLLLDTLGPEDKVAIVVYAGAAGTVLEPTKVAEKGKILAALEQLKAGGSTAGAEGVRQAYALAEANLDPEAVNRVILATDGDFNVGITDREELKSFIERKRKSGIFLSVLGFGQGNLNDHLMQTLAQNGNGVAAYIDTLNEARKVLVEEATSTLFPIAKDVKIQVEFNPDTVSEYRLIGYETRALAREDFANDKVDAGDIGAGHTVTAIYEITPKGSGNELIGQSRYASGGAKSETEFGNEYAFLKIRYKLPDGDRSTLVTAPITLEQEAAVDAAGVRSREARFATAVAAFGQLLKGGKYTGAYGYDQVIELAQGAKGEDRFGYRAEFINLVRLAKSAAALPTQ